MKYNKSNYTVSLIGARYGHTWDDRLCWQDVGITIREDESLDQRIEKCLAPDFQDGLLTSDSYLKITITKETSTSTIQIVRRFDITLFPSLSEYVGSMGMMELLGGLKP